MLSKVLGIDERELAAIFTLQTAGEALNFHPHLHGILADGYWKDGVFTRFSVIDIAALNQAFAERVLACCTNRNSLPTTLWRKSSRRSIQVARYG